MSAATKKPYSDVLPVASYLIAVLSFYCRRIALAGSLRRERSLIGDIEVVAIPLRRTDLFGQEIDSPTALDEFLDGRNVRFTKRGPSAEVAGPLSALTFPSPRSFTRSFFCFDSPRVSLAKSSCSASSGCSALNAAASSFSPRSRNPL